MSLQVQVFSHLAELCQSAELEAPMCSTVAQLRQHLESVFPLLSSETYAVAVNLRVAEPSTELQAGDKIALLPPFSGG